VRTDISSTGRVKRVKTRSDWFSATQEFANDDGSDDRRRDNGEIAALPKVRASLDSLL